MIFWSRRSDMRKERTWHLASAMLLCALGWTVTAIGTGNPYVTICGVVLANAGILAALSIFWSIPPMLLKGASAAVAIGLITAMGNVGSMIAPAVIGYARDITGTFQGAFSGLAVIATLAAILVIVISRGSGSSGKGIQLKRSASNR